MISRRSLIKGLLATPFARLVPKKTKVRWTVMLYGTPILFVPTKNLRLINVSEVCKDEFDSPAFLQM